MNETPRHILVTGGASGLGRAVVEQLLDRGDAVAVLDRAADGVEGAHHVQVDLADTRAAEDAVAAARASHASSMPSSRPQGSTSAAPSGRCPVQRGARDRRQPPGQRPWYGPLPIWRTRAAAVLIASTLGWRALPDATAYCASSSASSASPGRWPPSPRPGVTCCYPEAWRRRSSTAVPNGTTGPDAERPDGGRPQRAVRPRPASRMQCASCSCSPRRRAGREHSRRQRRLPRPGCGLVIDGVTVAAAEEERFSRRKHGKPAVPFSTWELPTAAMKWCLDQAGLQPPTSMPWPIPTTPTWRAPTT